MFVTAHTKRGRRNLLHTGLVALCLLQFVYCSPHTMVSVLTLHLQYPCTSYHATTICYIILILCTLFHPHTLTANPCLNTFCSRGRHCVLDAERNAECRCLEMADCPGVLQHVCGSDGRTYENLCLLQAHSCHSQRELQVQYDGECLSECGFGFSMLSLLLSQVIYLLVSIYHTIIIMLSI